MSPFVLPSHPHLSKRSHLLYLPDFHFADLFYIGFQLCHCCDLLLNFHSKRCGLHSKILEVFTGFKDFFQCPVIPALLLMCSLRLAAEQHILPRYLISHFFNLLKSCSVISKDLRLWF